MSCLGEIAPSGAMSPRIIIAQDVETRHYNLVISSIWKTESLRRSYLTSTRVPRRLDADPSGKMIFVYAIPRLKSSTCTTCCPVRRDQ